MRTVLVVDDERFFLTVLGDFVTQGLGMRALTAMDGPSALAMLEREPVDLVLLDIIMPGIDGLEVLRRIKKRWRTLPVIMITASAAIDNAVIALREGADDFFRKPVNLDDLALCVSRVLGRGGAEAFPSPSAAGPGAGRRGAPRIRMEEGLPAQMQVTEIRLLDISQTGALVEHTEPMTPGGIYRLCFPIEGNELQVLARAVRAVASYRTTLVSGDRRLVYRTGMEFVGVEKAASETIARYVESLMEQDPDQTLPDPPPAG